MISVFQCAAAGYEANFGLATMTDLLTMQLRSGSAKIVSLGLRQENSETEVPCDPCDQFSQFAGVKSLLPQLACAKRTPQTHRWLLI